MSFRFAESAPGYKVLVVSALLRVYLQKMQESFP